jgi:protein-S-isoprenylcysteine O-methyltransferase Ste14
MSISPPFQIGFLNLWICTALIFLIPEMINQMTAQGWRRACRLPGMSLGGKIIYFTWIGVNIVIYLYSFFVPLAIGAAWFAPGLLLFAASMVIMGMGTWAYQTTPEDELITKGIYRVSRNPGYFGTFCAYLGMGLMGTAWPIIVLAMAHLLMYQVTTIYEERMCNELYPDDFPGYKKEVKKNFLFF